MKINKMKKLTTLPILLISLTALAQIRYSKVLYKSTMHVKYFTYINNNGDLKYYHTDTIMATAVGYTAEQKDKHGNWYSTMWDFPNMQDKKYYLGGKQLFPIEIKEQDNVANSWSYIKKIN